MSGGFCLLNHSYSYGFVILSQISLKLSTNVFLSYFYEPKPGTSQNIYLMRSNFVWSTTFDPKFVCPVWGSGHKFSDGGFVQIKYYSIMPTQ